MAYTIWDGKKDIRKWQEDRDSSLTQSVRHAGGGNENCLTRTVHAARGWLKFEISLLPS